MSERFRAVIVLLALLGAAVWGCGGGGGSGGDSGDQAPAVSEAERQRLVDEHDLSALPEVPVPQDNPITEEKVTLGKKLFFDPIVSGNDDVACATCHFPTNDWDDNRPLPIGVGGVGLGVDRTHPEGRRLGRNVPTIINAAYADRLLWDGRADSLEAQALIAPENVHEMRGDMPPGIGVERALNDLRSLGEYLDLFRDAYPERTDRSAGELITEDTFAEAIASFERTLVANDAPFDRFVRGDPSALSEKQVAGLELFYGEAGCVQCHSGPYFSDQEFHALGVPQTGPEDPDLGRGEVTGDARDYYKFRTPTLRNVELTAPYMHDGVFPTLERVVEFKNSGVPLEEDVPASQIDEEFEPLGLSETEEEQLVAFLKTLTDTESLEGVRAPESVPSGLEVGGNIRRDGDLLGD